MDEPIWDPARELADDKKLSPVIVDALKKFIAAKEAETREFYRIEVRFDDSDRVRFQHSRDEWRFHPDYSGRQLDRHAAQEVIRK
jgi:hypothetical protein